MSAPRTTLPNDLKEVDVVIAGGGTSGCVVAARLSDADPNLSILVIEGGQDNFANPLITEPIRLLFNILPDSKTVLPYIAAKEPGVGDRELVVPSGGVLGGGSSVNLMTYSRGQREDFDGWQTEGWGANDLIPYLQRFETYEGLGEDKTHGKEGPIHVSGGTFSSTRAEEDFISAAAKLGIRESTDIQDLDTNNALQRNMRFISSDGKRQDAAHQYIHPRLRDGKHPNLHVLVENQVIRVLFENKTAVGVEYQPNVKFHADSAVRSIRARKLVVLSCGALGTPLVLERSGLGDPSVLEKAGVPMVAELPGVGHNYMDHHLLLHPYKSCLEPHETMDAIYGGRVDIESLSSTNPGMTGWNVADVTGKLRPSPVEVTQLGAAFKASWKRQFEGSPNKPGAIMTLFGGFTGDPTGVPPEQYFSVTTFTVYPNSRGHIHITGPNVSDPIDFATGILSDADQTDVKMSMWAYKKQREIVRRMKLYRGEYGPAHPPFSSTSDAAICDIDAPLANVRDIKYSAEDDQVLEQWVRRNVGTTWHSMGTCKMAPESDLGVVDPTLGVYGVRNLKIADLSIPPTNVAANTAHAAFMIGEKAADLFKMDLGL